MFLNLLSIFAAVMWLTLVLISALFLGIYDITKKKSLEKNSVLWVLFATTVLSVILLVPVFKTGDIRDYLILLPKAVLVTMSWVSGLAGMKLLPLTTVSTMKASRPVFVIIFSMIIFGERLNWMQWTGVLISLTALWMLSRSSRREGIPFSSSKGVLWMVVSILTGVCSALYDKHILKTLDPIFVLCWSNLFIAALLGIVLAIKSIHEGKARDRFRWDWYLLLTAIFIISADACYFIALSQEDALLSVVSLLRRCSVIVTFILGAVIFKEKYIRAKAVDLAVLLAGMSILVLAS